MPLGIKAKFRERGANSRREKVAGGKFRMEGVESESDSFMRDV